MDTRAFNLIDEPWIKVRNLQSEVKLVSVRELLLYASEYVALAGETETQNVAVLRFILALFYTVWMRYDDEGNKINAEDEVEEDVDYFFDRYVSMLKNKSLPVKAFEVYFEEMYDRFWLFNNEHPFYQSNCVAEKTFIPAAKMIGTLFESNNKPRLFASRNKEGRNLSYAEAARWLLHLICFDDIAAKKPTPKKTWVSRLGIVFAKGENLYETIMFNFCATCDSDSLVYISKPSWEADDGETAEPNRLVAPPQNQAELLSLISRRVCLHENDGMVDGFFLTGGDYFEDEEVFQENMTLWRYDEKNKNEGGYRPQIHLPSRQIWKEFGSIAMTAQSEEKNRRRPGVVEWLDRLIDNDVIKEEKNISIASATVVYNYGQATSLPVIDLIQDEMSLQASLLKQASEIWREIILSEISKIEDSAKAIRGLSINLQKAAGDSGEKISGEEAASEFYGSIDREFRIWLSELKTDSDCEKYRGVLEDRISRIAFRQGNNMVHQQGEKTFFSPKGKMSSAEALNIFAGRIRNIYPNRKEVKNNE